MKSNSCSSSLIQFQALDRAAEISFSLELFALILISSEECNKNSQRKHFLSPFRLIAMAFAIDSSPKLC
jgi:hypothetical protein